MALSSQVWSHSPTVTLDGSTNVWVFVWCRSSVSRFWASRFVPRNVIHFCFRVRRPGPVQKLLRVGRHLLRAVHYRLLRTRAFGEWDTVTCAR